MCLQCKQGERGYFRMRRILIYDKNGQVQTRMIPVFDRAEYEMQVTDKAEEVYEILHNEKVHLLLLDIELGDKGWDRGIEMIAKLRAMTGIPMIVMSAQTAETAKIMALEAGADDYVTMECNPLEVMARIKSQLRRYTQLVSICTGMERSYQVEGLVIDDIRRQVTVEGRMVRLTPIEYKILRFLVQERGQVFSNSQIYEKIWNMRAVGADNTIAVHIRHIREKIENNPREPKYLKAVWGTGYKIG